MGQADLEPAVLRVLSSAGAPGLTKAEIVAAIGTTTGVSVQRALKRLREDRDAKITCDGAGRRWRLNESFTMPLDAPEAEDVVAVLVAKAILAPLADRDLVDRIERLAEQLDERRRERGDAPRRVTAAVTATLTLGTKVEPGVLRVLLGACRTQVVRILYESPWKAAAGARRWYEVEPWALRVHDGAAYLRAWRRDIHQARTFRVAHIEAVETVTAEHSLELARVPASPALWGDDDPAFGIDEDRRGVAVLVLHGPVARWVHRVQWHPTQVDRWIDPGELLERTVPYRSCRELARRIASVHDAVRSIEPAALRDEVAALIAAPATTTAAAAELPPAMHRVPAEHVDTARPAGPASGRAAKV